MSTQQCLNGTTYVTVVNQQMLNSEEASKGKLDISILNVMNLPECTNTMLLWVSPGPAVQPATSVDRNSVRYLANETGNTEAPMKVLTKPHICILQYSITEFVSSTCPYKLLDAFWIGSLPHQAS